MSRSLPVRFYPDRMPVDISFVFEHEKPAGKHGFCQVDGDQLKFEDGTPARFWGVIFNGACCFPEHTYAHKVANRLAQAGCNIVRFHQMDAEWATPNLYRITAGKRLVSTRKLCEESMERMDYLIKCLKEQGIYIVVDVTTYRKFKSGDGVIDADLLSDNMKAVALYDPVMIELQKEFARDFWNHHNPYTGLCYKDDPVFVLCDITNENDLFCDHSNNKLYHNRSEYYDKMFRDMFRKWLTEQGIEYDAYGCPLYTKDAPMIGFRIHLSKQYYEGMYACLRQIGVKIPLCGTNWAMCGGLVKSQENMDFQDGHYYFYDWKWGEYEKVTFNRSITEQQTSCLGSTCATRIHGQPMFMTEWDMPWPNASRSEAPIWFPAQACLQGWSGMTIHTYAYGTNLSEYDLLGKEASSSTIGSVPYREGIFTAWNDPSKFGLFYHGALMLRRGDVSPAQKTIGAQVTNYAKNPTTLPSTAMETHRVDAVLDTTDISDLEDVRPIEEKFQREDPNMIISDTGQLWRNVKKRIGAVDTPRTKAVYGYIGSRNENMLRKGMGLQLDGMQIDCMTDFATIALSSLTDAPIEDSDSMLLSTIGRSWNRGALFVGEKMLEFGTGPIEVEVIEADIAIRTNCPDLRVWSVNSDGYYVGKLDTTYDDGWLRFRVGPNYASMYYLIMQE